MITGSSSGIGLAIASSLASEGASIVLNGRHQRRLDEVKDLVPGAMVHAADVRSPDDCQCLVEAVVAEYGRLDILVCNVGSGVSVPPGQETPEEWQRILDLNLHTTTQMVWAATDALSEVSGNIVCISSICGLEALGCPIPYAAAKAALQSFVSARPLASLV